MELNELSADEQMVLLGLMREIVTADGAYTDEEREEVTALESDMGSDAFVTAMTRAKDEFRSRNDVVEAAKTVTREAAQKIIMDRLIRVASSDGAVESEEKPLRWLAGAWPGAVRN